MNKTKIEWTDYTWPIITGCLGPDGKGPCPYCYARKMIRRFHTRYPNGFNPTFYPEKLSEPHRLKGHRKIFVASMGDMWGEWVDQDWIDQILNIITLCPKHQFQMLTKNPDRAMRYSQKHPFPFNAWIGSTIDFRDVQDKRIAAIRNCNAKIKFISYEPILEDMGVPDLSGIHWIIIGAKTNPLKLPEAEWVENLMDAAAKKRIPVFLKDNLLIEMENDLSRTPQNFPLYFEQEMK